MKFVLGALWAGLIIQAPLAMAACPPQSLQCDLMKPLVGFAVTPVKTITAKFEPTVGQSQCFAAVHFSVADTGAKYGLNAAVDDEFTGLIWVGNESDVIGPQYSFEAEPGKGVSVTYERLKMICWLQSPAPGL